MPPSRKFDMNPSAKSIGGFNAIDPRHIVPIQLKNLMPVGTAIRNDMIEKNGFSTAPVVNMWCAHTVIDKAAMAIDASTIPEYPNSGLRENTGTISVTTRQNGRHMMYHSGRPKNEHKS